MLRLATLPWSKMCECARRVFRAAFPSRVKRYFPRGPKFFTTGNIAFGGLISQYWAIQLGLLRGPHWPFRGPEQLARICDIAIILLAIINVMVSIVSTLLVPLIGARGPGNAKS